MSQQYTLRWNNHQSNFVSTFKTLLDTQTLVDVTLDAEGEKIMAHKVVLSACSTYFRSLFVGNPSPHNIVMLKDVTFADLRLLVDFIYSGEVTVTEEQLPKVLRSAKSLEVKGLIEMSQSLDAARHSEAPSPSGMRRRRGLSSTDCSFETAVESERGRAEVAVSVENDITVPVSRRSDQQPRLSDMIYELWMMAESSQQHTRTLQHTLIDAPYTNNGQNMGAAGPSPRPSCVNVPAPAETTLPQPIPPPPNPTAPNPPPPNPTAPNPPPPNFTAPNSPPPNSTAPNSPPTNPTVSNFPPTNPTAPDPPPAKRTAPNPPKAKRNAPDPPLRSPSKRQRKKKNQ